MNSAVGPTYHGFAAPRPENRLSTRAPHSQSNIELTSTLLPGDVLARSWAADRQSSLLSPLTSNGLPR